MSSFVVPAIISGICIHAGCQIGEVYLSDEQQAQKVDRLQRGFFLLGASQAAETLMLLHLEEVITIERVFYPLAAIRAGTGIIAALEIFQASDFKTTLYKIVIISAQIFEFLAIMTLSPVYIMVAEIASFVQSLMWYLAIQDHDFLAIEPTMDAPDRRSIAFPAWEPFNEAASLA